MSDEKIKRYDVRKNSEWERHGFTAENRPSVSVNAFDVPESFRHLIPYVERWAISCDVIRGDYFSKQPQADIDDFYQMVLPHLDALNLWLQTQPWTEAKADFLAMLKSHCEATPPPPPEQIAETRRRRFAEREAKRTYWKGVYQRTKGRELTKPIRVVLPFHLRSLARVEGEVSLEVPTPVTIGSVLDALEARFPMLRGTLRDHGTLKRRPFIRFFVCKEDWSLELPDKLLPEEITGGAEPFLIVGAMAGG